MRNLDELNINCGGEPVQRRSPDARLFEQFRLRFGVEVPLGLQRLLLHTNGGHPEVDSIVLDAAEDDVVAVDYFCYLLDGDEGLSSLPYAMTHHRSGLPRGALPFAFDGGNNPFFVDGAGKVLIYRWEHMPAISTVAESFEAFLDALAMNEDYI